MFIRTALSWTKYWVPMWTLMHSFWRCLTLLSPLENLCKLFVYSVSQCWRNFCRIPPFSLNAIHFVQWCLPNGTHLLWMFSSWPVVWWGLLRRQKTMWNKCTNIMLSLPPCPKVMLVCVVSHSLWSCQYVFCAADLGVMAACWNMNYFLQDCIYYRTASLVH